MATEMTFDEKLLQAIQQSLIKIAASGEWCKLDYNARIPISAADLRAVYAKVDMGRVPELVKERAEERIADAFFNSMATELATDLKKILGNTELREDIRAVIREKIRTAAEAISQK